MSAMGPKKTMSHSCGGQNPKDIGDAGSLALRCFWAEFNSKLIREKDMDIAGISSF